MLDVEFAPYAWIVPNRLEDLRQVISHVELIIELRVASSVFGFDPEVHQGRNEVRERQPVNVECIAEDAVGVTSPWNDIVEQDLGKFGFEEGVLDVPAAAEERSAECYQVVLGRLGKRRTDA